MKLGIVGFGEVGYSFASGFKEAGMKDILVFDKMWDSPEYGQVIKKRQQEISIEVLTERESLVKGADIIIAVTTADVAVNTAEELKPWLKEGMVYADFNSASPMVKKEIANLVEQQGASFVDGVIMTPPGLDKHKAKIFLSGSGADKLYKFGLNWDMNLHVVGKEPGQAATIKMLRSIWAKGIEALFIEAFHAANTYGITDYVFDSIKDFMNKYSFDELVNMLVISNVNHSLRRSFEMEDVAKTLTAARVDARMSEAIRDKLVWSAELGLKEIFKDELPADFHEVMRAISQKS